ARALRAWSGAKLRIHASVRTRAVAIDQRLPVFERPSSGLRLLDRHRLHLVVLGPSIRLQKERQSAVVGADFRRIARLYLAVRRLFLWRRLLAVPAVAAHRSAARPLLPVGAAL